MHSSTADPQKKPEPKIVVEDYPRMETYGGTALGLGVIGAAVLITVGFATHAVVPTGTAALTMGLFLAGCILLVGRVILRKQDQVRVELEDHKADHHVAQIDTEDLAAIKSDVAKILAFMARRDLEDQEVDKLIRQVEEFTAWRARVTQQLAVLTGDDVIDLGTVRDLKQLSERRRDNEQ